MNRDHQTHTKTSTATAQTAQTKQMVTEAKQGKRSTIKKKNSLSAYRSHKEFLEQSSEIISILGLQAKQNT